MSDYEKVWAFKKFDEINKKPFTIKTPNLTFGNYTSQFLIVIKNLTDTPTHQKIPKTPLLDQIPS